jgi:hypothetical protein
MTWPRKIEVDGFRQERRHVEVIAKPHYPEIEKFGKTFLRVRDLRTHLEFDLEVEMKVADLLTVGDQIFTSRCWRDAP